MDPVALEPLGVLGVRVAGGKVFAGFAGLERFVPALNADAQADRIQTALKAAMNQKIPEASACRKVSRTSQRTA
jgi:hypothetical protein